MNIEDFAFIFMGLLILIILYILIGKMLEHKHIHIIHQTGIGILIGIIFGLLMLFTKNIKDIDFSQQIFFYGLLPPMIFAGGYNLKKEDFGKNIKYIFIFGVLGTIVAFGAIFGLTYLIDHLDLVIPMGGEENYEQMDLDLMVKYSATISATDSVAALTLINPAQYPKLFSIIFGEGMVNDAVAIILFKVVGDIVSDITKQAHEANAGQIAWEIIWKFVVTVSASLGIGAVCALMCSLLFKNFRFLVNNEITQVAITYLFGILSYVIAETLDMSGVITVLVCGVMLAHYNFYNLTPGGMHTTTVCFQFIAFIAQAIVFVYLGLSVIFYFYQYQFSIVFIALQVLVCFLARFISIFGVTFIFRLFTKWKVSMNQLAVVCAAGSIRGSVALALILTIQNEEGNHQISIIKSTVLIMVCLTTIVLGGIMPKFVSYFMGKQVSLAIQSQQKLTQQAQQEQPKNEKKEKKGFLSNIEKKYMKRWFIHDYENSRQAYKMYKNIIKSNNKDAALKEINKLFVLKDLKLINQEYQNIPGRGKKNQSFKDSLVSSSLE